MYKHVAVIVDESPEAERAVGSAIALAGKLGSHLHLFTVIRPPSAYTAYAAVLGPEASQTIELDRFALYAELEAKVVSLAQSAGLTTTSHRIPGTDVDHIIDLLRTEKADLVVIGLHRANWVVSRLWNKVFELAQASPCSILGVH